MSTKGSRKGEAHPFSLDRVPAGEATAVRFAVADRTVTDGGPWLREATLHSRVDGGEEQTSAAHFVGGDVFWAQLPAFDDVGAQGQYWFCATDLQGNAACSEEQTFGVGESTDETSGGTSGGTNGTGGSTSDAGASDAMASTATDGAATGGSDTRTPGADDDAGAGCGCQSSTHAPSWLTLLLGIGLVRRRRRPVR